MNRAWLTAVTLAGVAGSAGAAFAGVVAVPDASATPSAVVNPGAALLATPVSTEAAAAQTTYQISGVATVGMVARGATLTVGAVTTVPGWTVQSISIPGPHVSVTLAGGSQLVTFGATLTGGHVEVTLTNDLIGVPEPTTVAPPVTIAVQVVPPQQHTPAPKPATPTAKKPVTTTPHTTTAPSKSGDDDSEPNDD